MTLINVTLSSGNWWRAIDWCTAQFNHKNTLRQKVWGKEFVRSSVSADEITGVFRFIHEEDAVLFVLRWS